MVAVITGASKGIGFNIAKQLAKQGYIVYSLSRTKPEDSSIKHIYCDMANHKSIKDAFKEFFEKEKQIDLLVNNAGMGISGAVENTSESDMHNIFNINFFGAAFCSQQVVNKMRSQGFGKIVFISSVGSVFTLPFQVFYSATKTAINSLSEGLKMELKPFNIKVGTILLGDIKSSFTQNRKKDFTGEEFYKKRIERSVSVMERDEQNGMSAEKISIKISKYLNKKNINPYKVFGFKYKLFCFLNRLLPKKWAISIIYSIYGK